LTLIGVLLGLVGGEGLWAMIYFGNIYFISDRTLSISKSCDWLPGNLCLMTLRQMCPVCFSLMVSRPLFGFTCNVDQRQGLSKLKGQSAEGPVSG
jgi:hypothetical protein